jgi:hypothetical protein
VAAPGGERRQNGRDRHLTVEIAERGAIQQHGRIEPDGQRAPPGRRLAQIPPAELVEHHEKRQLGQDAGQLDGRGEPSRIVKERPRGVVDAPDDPELVQGHRRVIDRHLGALPAQHAPLGRNAADPVDSRHVVGGRETPDLPDEDVARPGQREQHAPQQGAGQQPGDEPPPATHQ